MPQRCVCGIFVSVSVTFLVARSFTGFETEPGEELSGVLPVTLIVGFVWVCRLGLRMRGDLVGKEGKSVVEEDEVASEDDIRIATVREDPSQHEGRWRGVCDELLMSRDVRDVIAGDRLSEPAKFVAEFED